MRIHCYTGEVKRVATKSVSACFGYGRVTP